MNTDNLGNIDDINPTTIHAQFEDLTKPFANVTGLKIIHFNIRSIRKHFDELSLILQESPINFDVIILSETQLTNTNINLYNIDGYTTFHFSNKITRFDGMSILIKNWDYDDLSITKVEQITQANCVKMEIKLKSESFTILAVYRSPSSKLKLFINELHTVLTNLKDKHVILIGDINIDINENIMKESQDTEDYLNSLCTNGFIPMIKQSTRVSSQSHSCIDHIFLKSRQVSKFLTAIVHSSMTDHYPVIIGLHNEILEPKQGDEKTMQKIVNYSKLEESLNSETWESVLSENRVEVAASNFVDILQKHTNKNTKTKCIKISNKNKKIKPWITLGLIKSIRHRDSLSKKVLKYPDNLLLKKDYQKYRNQLTECIRLAKNDYFRNKISDANSDVKKVWGVINESTGKEKPSKAIKKIEINNKKINTSDDPLLVAETFLSYFSNIGKDMAENIQNKLSTQPNNNNNTQRNNQNTFNIRREKKSIFLSPTTDEEIISHINELKADSAPGYDSISVKIIKAIKLCIIKPLQHIIDLSFTTGSFPNIFKKSVIIPIHKKGDKTIVSNYRPISLISNIAKVHEKCIKKRLYEYFEANKILSPNQFGFRRGLSTQNAIHSLSDTIASLLDINKKPLAIFIDLAKAFDTVSHKLLLKKLEKYGIRGLALQLLKEYLSDREQYVKVNETLSSSTIIEYGIPQGTVLGPLLFTIFINDLCNAKLKCKVIAFADDTVLIFSGNTWKSTYNTAEIEMGKIKMWLDENLLTLNEDKTLHIAFSPSKTNQPNNESLRIHKQTCNTNSTACNCSEIKKTPHTQYLGVIVDQHLKWDVHIRTTCKKLRNCLYKYYTLRTFLNLASLKIVYYALTQSILEYGIIDWGGTYYIHLKPLITIQKCILKVIMKRPISYPTADLYDECKILDIRKLYVKNIAKYVHKNITSFKKITHLSNTRNKINNNLEIPRTSKKLAQNQVTFLGPKLYNAIPVEIRGCPSSITFMCLVKKWIFSIPITTFEKIINLKPYRNQDI